MTGALKLFCSPLTVALITLLFVSGSAFADTHYVPDDFLTIQEALDRAVDGDTIIVRDGTHTGAGNKNLDFGGKAVTLKSENGPANCIIDCENDDRAFTFDDGEEADSVVDGFTVINGLATGSWPDDHGGGISCERFSSPTITNCVISNNTAGGDGGGIVCYASSPTITNCTISANSARYGGGIFCGHSEPSFTNCILWGNSAWFGEEMYLANISSLTV
ncbi:MAG: right-handed parallel beta-helix repeat-containing protein, partial [Candidatus Hydrogenedentota bacterium]